MSKTHWRNQGIEAAVARIEELETKLDRAQHQRYLFERACLAVRVALGLGLHSHDDIVDVAKELVVKLSRYESAERELPEIANAFNDDKGQQVVPWVYYAILRAAAVALKVENDSLSNKALRFDLDQAGIEKRELEACELVELRAKLATARQEERERCAKVCETEEVMQPLNNTERNTGHACATAIRALTDEKEKA